MDTYTIHESKTGHVLAKLELPEDRIEAVSSDNDQGHFQANRLDELAALGDQSVYAILH